MALPKSRTVTEEGRTPTHNPTPRKRRIIDSRHPSVLQDQNQWLKWRLTYAGGQEYLNRYLVKYDKKEDVNDFRVRKSMTPLPTHAKAALNDIRNAIFQRMRDIIRRDGSESYTRAVAGLDGGVDLRGQGMNSFMGKEILTDLLTMGRVGLYVDMPNMYTEDLRTPTLADVEGMRPYIYMYQIEDILSWTCSRPEEISEYQAVLLRDSCLDFDQDTLLPINSFQRFRLIWINQQTGFVNMQFLDAEGNPVDAEGNPTLGQVIELELRQIPFVMLHLNGSLLRDVSQHQIALLNLISSDVTYGWKANFPFYTEQRDMRGIGDHLKHNVNPDGTAEAGGQRSHLKEFQAGPTQGRAYDISTDRPGFIHPSSEPLVASMKLREQLKNEIRELVNLSVANMANRASAESKSMDNQGLEAGLSYIGLVMETAERKLASYWASYEDRRPDRRLIAVVKYPDRYRLKEDGERIEEADKLVAVIQQAPSSTARKELWKMITNMLLTGRISVDDMGTINSEIDAAPFTTSDPETILAAVEAGISGEETAAMALGFEKGEVEKARADHAARIARIQAAQSSGDGEGGGENQNLAARGVGDLDVDPQSGKKERQKATQTDLSPERKKPVRGRGRKTK